MLKNILKLDGAQKLSKNEQKKIVGGNIKPPIPCKRECVQYDAEGNATGGCEC